MINVVMSDYAQAQYVFIHDVIKHKLESLGYGVTSSASDDDEDDDNDDTDLYQSKCGVGENSTLFIQHHCKEYP